jgi:tetratricopeptide (TPR) repeat protein
MNKIFSVILGISYLISDLHADYQDNWTKGIEYLKKNDFELAEKELTIAINQLEQLQDVSKPLLYIDRSEAYSSLKMYKEAIDDLNKVLLSDQLNNNERVKGLYYRMLACMDLGLDYSQDSKEIDRISPNSYEINDTSMIIKNVPDNEILRGMMTKYLIGSGFCEGEQNIKILDSGEMVIEKSENGWGKNLILKNDERI